MEDNDVLWLLINNGISLDDTIDIPTFLPIAFTRTLFPKANWLDTYLEHDGHIFTSRRFSETKSYELMKLAVERFFKSDPCPETIIKIAGRSSEFHAMNRLLLENPDAKIEDIQFTETVINRSFAFK